MDYKDLQEYVQERWEGTVALIEEKKLNDYALGRAMIKLSKSKNPINKRMQASGKKKAEKYFKKQHDEYVNKMAKAAGYVAGMLKQGKITLNDNSVVVKGTINGKPEYINAKIEHVKDYLKKQHEKGEIGEYSVKISNGEYTVNIKIAKY